MRTSLLPKIILLIAFVAGPSVITAQDLSVFKEESLISRKGELPYRIMMPKRYNPDIKYPLLIFLHGSGERGSDNQAQLKHGASLFASDSIREKYPAIVVFPQCEEDGYWVKLKYDLLDEGVDILFPRAIVAWKEQAMLEDLLKELKKSLPVDEDRIYIGGLSMGAMGTFELVRRNPREFAAAFAICGGANPAIAGKLKRLPWWIFHGDADQVVPIRYSRQLVESMRRQDIDVKFTTYPGVGHDSWTPTFANPELLEWLFAQVKD